MGAPAAPPHGAPPVTSSTSGALSPLDATTAAAAAPGIAPAAGAGAPLPTALERVVPASEVVAPTGGAAAEATPGGALWATARESVPSPAGPTRPVALFEGPAVGGRSAKGRRPPVRPQTPPDAPPPSTPAAGRHARGGPGPPSAPPPRSMRRVRPLWRPWPPRARSLPPIRPVRRQGGRLSAAVPFPPAWRPPLRGPRGCL